MSVASEVIYEKLVMDDMPRDDDADRYAIYAVNLDGRAIVTGKQPNRSRLAETSKQGIGACIVQLREDGDITDDTRVGIFDRRTRKWVVNPWAVGRL